MHKFFLSITNVTLLDDALRAYAEAQSSGITVVDIELRIALVMMLLHDADGCFRSLDKVLAVDGFNEAAHLYRGYCYDALRRDAASAKRAFDQARAMDIHGADRFYSSA